MAVIRYTYGFRRDTAHMSLGYLSELTNISPDHISKILKGLKNRHIITIYPACKLKPQRVKLNGCQKWQ